MNNMPMQLAETLQRGVTLSETGMGIKKGQPLIEATGWKEMVEGIRDPMKKAFVALMLENYKTYRRSLDETTSTLQVGNYDKWAFPILSIVSENLIAQDLVSVQPLQGPSGLVFYMNFVLGQTKGAAARGSKVWDARTGHAERYQDSSDRVEGEQLGTATNGDLSGVGLTYVPVMPGTVQITLVADGSVYKDDNNGSLLDSGNSAVGSIDYSTGAVTLTTSVATGAAVADYSYNSELNSEAQQIDFEITSSPIYTRERKLRGRWSTEAAQALEALHKVNAENMVSTGITNHLQWEIDREIIELLRRNASAGLVQWNAQIPSNSHISYTEHKLSFIDALTTASNFILSGTNRARANWFLTGIQGANVVETLPQFEPVSGDKAEAEGVMQTGSIGRVKVYSDPHYRDDEALVGYKGSDLTRAGAVFAPWLLLYTTATIVLDDFVARKAYASQYGLKVLNSKFYSKIKLSGQSASFNAGGVYP